MTAIRPKTPSRRRPRLLRILVLLAGLGMCKPGTEALAGTPASFTGITKLSDGSIQLFMSGFAESAYVLEFSYDLVGWTPLTILTNSSGLVEFNDASRAEQRFYRLHLAIGTNSSYWAKALATHNYITANLLTPYQSYRNHPGSTEAYQWYNASQIYADAAMLFGGDSSFESYMNNSFAWMTNLWDATNPAGGYVAAANINGTAPGGGKYVDDNSLAGNVYLDAYSATSGATRSNYLSAAMATANWLMFSGQWDTAGGGFWWSDSKTVKPTQSNGLALQLFLRLYSITHQTYYRDWADSVKNWLENQMYDASDGLYIWQIETNSFKNPIKFTYDNAMMIEADLLYAQIMNQTSYVAKAENLAAKLNAKLWNPTYKAYYFNSADGRVNPCWCGWASQSLIRLYEADANPSWLIYAQQNIDYMNARLRNPTNGFYYVFCNMDGSNVENRIEGVDQSWMQRIQSLMARYR